MKPYNAVGIQQDDSAVPVYLCAVRDFVRLDVPPESMKPTDETNCAY